MTSPLDRPVGVVDYPSAIRWAGHKVFQNWKVWILGAFAVLAVFALIGVAAALATPTPPPGEVATSPVWVDYLAGFIGAVITPYMWAGLLYQTTHTTMRWSGFTQITTSRVIKTLNIMAIALVAQLGIALLFLSLPLTVGVSQGVGLALMAVFFLVNIALIPIFEFWVPTAADSAEGTPIMQIVRTGTRYGVRNYWPILGWTVLLSVVAVLVTVCTFGLLSVVVFPMLYLVQVYVFKQVRNP